MQVALHHLDLLLLFDNDTLSKTPQLKGKAVSEASEVDAPTVYLKLSLTFPRALVVEVTSFTTLATAIGRAPRRSDGN